MKKKHSKERAGIQKLQNSTVEKLIKGKSKDEIKADQNVRKTIADQTEHWSQLCDKHKKEEWELLKTQISDQQEILKRIMETAQAGQMKQMEGKHERETKALNSQQAKTSVETAKEVANDKTLRTKGEKDRRLREKKQNNIKRFMDEKKVSWRLPRSEHSFSTLFSLLFYSSLLSNHRTPKSNKAVKRRSSGSRTRNRWKSCIKTFKRYYDSLRIQLARKLRALKLSSSLFLE